MKPGLFVATLLLCNSFAFADPCLPGSLQSYIDLGSGGCTLGVALFADFTTVAGQSFATPIDPSLVQVTPDGAFDKPTLEFTLNADANANELLESIFRFDVTAGGLSSSTLTLGPASTATGDGVATATEDVCAGGFFVGDQPLGCPGSASSLITFAADFGSSRSDTASFSPTSFFDIFVDLTVDGGAVGSAHLDSATVQVTAVPEPSSVLLLLTIFGALSARLVRRNG